MLDHPVAQHKINAGVLYGQAVVINQKEFIEIWIRSCGRIYVDPHHSSCSVAQDTQLSPVRGCILFVTASSAPDIQDGAFGGYQSVDPIVEGYRAVNGREASKCDLWKEPFFQVHFVFSPLGAS